MVFPLQLGRTSSSVRAKFKEFKTDRHKVVEQFFHHLSAEDTSDFEVVSG